MVARDSPSIVSNDDTACYIFVSLHGAPASPILNLRIHTMQHAPLPTSIPSTYIIWPLPFPHMQSFFGRGHLIIPRLRFEKKKFLCVCVCVFVVFVCVCVCGGGLLLFCFLKCRSARSHQLHCSGQDQSTVAQRAETTVDGRSLTSCV